MTIPTPKAEPIVPIAVIETDAFCEECGFNLHTQKVWRDERLDISICRCPECGRHHAAGMRTTAGSAWARRAALGALVVWLLVQLAFVVGVFFMFVGFSAAASDGLIHRDFSTLDGRPVVERGIPNTTTCEYALDFDQPFNVPPESVVYGKRLAPWLTGGPRLSNDDISFATPLQSLMIAGAFALLTLAAGAMMASASWFWRRGMKWLWLLVPMLSTLLVAALLTQEERYMRSWTSAPLAHDHVEVRLMLVVGALITLTLAVGLAIGRRVARLVVSVFIPPKARQLFAFLWHCDGLTMPSSKP